MPLPVAEEHDMKEQEQIEQSEQWKKPTANAGKKGPWKNRPCPGA